MTLLPVADEPVISVFCVSNRPHGTQRTVEGLKEVLAAFAGHRYGTPVPDSLLHPDGTPILIFAARGLTSFERDNLVAQIAALPSAEEAMLLVRVPLRVNLAKPVPSGWMRVSIVTYAHFRECVFAPSELASASAAVRLAHPAAEPHVTPTVGTELTVGYVAPRLLTPVEVLALNRFRRCPSGSLDPRIQPIEGLLGEVVDLLDATAPVP